MIDSSHPDATGLAPPRGMTHDVPRGDEPGQVPAVGRGSGHRAFAGLVAGLALVVSGCGGGAGPQALPSSAPPATNAVETPAVETTGVQPPAVESPVVRPPSAGPGSGPTTPAAPRAANGVTLPKVVVTDVTTDASVDLSTLLPGRQPLLVWMWAPH